MILHKWKQEHAWSATYWRAEYKTNVLKAAVSWHGNIWMYTIFMSDGTKRIASVTSPKEGMKRVDVILAEDGCKFLDDERLSILL